MANTDPLALDRETMRDFALRTVDFLVDWLNDADAPVSKTTGMCARRGDCLTYWATSYPFLPGIPISARTMS